MLRTLKRGVVLAAVLALVSFGGLDSPSVRASTYPMTSAEAMAVQGTGCLGCALAIAGTLTVSVGAIWVTGPASLYYFLWAKGLATGALIDSCMTCAE